MSSRKVVENVFPKQRILHEADWSYFGTVRPEIYNDDADDWVPDPDSNTVDLYEHNRDHKMLGFVVVSATSPMTPVSVNGFTYDQLGERGAEDCDDEDAFWGVVYKYVVLDGKLKKVPCMDTMTKLGPWELYEAMLEAKHARILSYGPPGLGKSYSPAKWAKKNDAFYCGITLTDQTPMSELRGHFILKGNEFVWHDGVVARAWRKSHEGVAVLVLNEINEAGTDVETFLHNVLDDPEFARLDLPNGDVVRPCPDNMITVATMNGIPQNLREALRDRFPVKIPVDCVHPDALMSLPSDLRPLAERMTNPKMGKNRLSIRPFVAFASLRRHVATEIAAQAIFGDGAHDIIAALAIAETA